MRLQGIALGGQLIALASQRLRFFMSRFQGLFERPAQLGIGDQFFIGGL